MFTHTRKTEVLTLGSKKSHKPSVLLVDDSEEFITTTMILLQDYDIQSASNGREALDFLEKSLPDIILIDSVMPKMSGLVLIR